MSTDATPAPPEDRKAHIELADAESRIDGLTRDPQTDPVFAAYASGEITVTDLVARLHALFGL